MQEEQPGGWPCPFSAVVHLKDGVFLSFSFLKSLLLSNCNYWSHIVDASVCMLHQQPWD